MNEAETRAEHIDRALTAAAGWSVAEGSRIHREYASDLKDPAVKKELVACRTAIERGEKFDMRTLRPYKGIVGEEWFAKLRMDPASLSDRSARPRP